MQTIIMPDSPKIVKSEKNLAIFEIKPLFPGYGVIIGNSLRRVLFSSMPGAAITSVKIAGVSHEFSTIPYVMEDVVEIILNLKQLRFKMYSDNPIKIYLKAKGEKKVKAGDIKISSDVEIANKEARIAVLTDKKASLEMEMVVEKGLGYFPIEQRIEAKLPIGTIAIDAIFTPMKKVKYEVENMRVGRMTDYNKLTLEIETDGTISPEEAFKSAAEIVVEHFAILGDSKKIAKEEIKKAKKKDEKNKKNEEKKDSIAEEKTEKKEITKEEQLPIKISELGLSTKTINVLNSNRVKTINSLIKKKEKDLIKMDGLGAGGIKEIKRELGKFGLIIKS